MRLAQETNESFGKERSVMFCRAMRAVPLFSQCSVHFKEIKNALITGMLFAFVMFRILFLDFFVGAPLKCFVKVQELMRTKCALIYYYSPLTLFL